MPRDPDPRPLPIARPAVPDDADDGVPVRRERLRAARTPWLVPALAIGGVLVAILAVAAVVLLKGRGGVALPDWHGMRWNEAELVAHLSNADGQQWYYTEQYHWPKDGLNQFICDTKLVDDQKRTPDDAIVLARVDARADRKSNATGFETYLWYDWGRFGFSSRNRPLMEKLKRALPGGTGNF